MKVKKNKQSGYLLFFMFSDVISFVDNFGANSYAILRIRKSFQFALLALTAHAADHRRIMERNERKTNRRSITNDQNGTYITSQSINDEQDNSKVRTLLSSLLTVDDALFHLRPLEDETFAAADDVWIIESKSTVNTPRSNRHIINDQQDDEQEYSDSEIQEIPPPNSNSSKSKSKSNSTSTSARPSSASDYISIDSDSDSVVEIAAPSKKRKIEEVIPILPLIERTSKPIKLRRTPPELKSTCTPDKSITVPASFSLSPATPTGMRDYARQLMQLDGDDEEDGLEQFDLAEHSSESDDDTMKLDSTHPAQYDSSSSASPMFTLDADPFPPRSTSTNNSNSNSNSNSKKQKEPRSKKKKLFRGSATPHKAGQQPNNTIFASNRSKKRKKADRKQKKHAVRQSK
jgi:hypothetical protein